ncbi:MAG: CHASE2 domain-containing protein [Steroidobacteraceae bacterium]
MWAAGRALSERVMRARLLAIVSGSAVGVLCAVILAVPQVRALEQRAGLHWLFKLRGPVDPPDSVVLILLNQQAANSISLPRDAERFHHCEDLQIGVHPPTHVSLPAMPSRWPRCLHTQLLGQLADAGASLVVFDVLFRERPPLPSSSGDLNDWQDASMAVAASRVRVLVAQKVELNDGHESLAELSPAIANAVLGSAPFPLVVEPDRRVDRFMAFKQEGLATPTLPAIALQAYAMAGYPFLLEFLTRHAGETATLLPQTVEEIAAQGQLQATSLLIRQMFRADAALADRLREELHNASFRDTGGASLDEIRALAALYSGEGTRLLNLYGPAGTIPAVSYGEVLQSTPEANAARFWNKVVFVGFGERARTEQIEHFATAYSSKDGADLSGVEIAASAFSNLLEDRTLHEMPIGWSLALTFLTGLLAYLACDRFGNRLGAAVVAAGVAAYAIGALYLFEERQLWLPLVGPLLVAVPAAMLGAFGWKFWTAHKQRAQLRHAFSYFVPQDVVSALERNAGEISKSQESIECACVATDAANFTPLAEAMTPEQLTDFLNRYFESLFGRVADRGGFVSDVVGDAMLAIWPHRAADTHVRLLHALLEMRDAAQQFNERLAGNRLMTRFGVDWGRVSLSTVGAHGHYEYRAVGDAVNTATRIQELNKKLGTRILLSESAIGDAGGAFMLRDLGHFLLRGKSHAIHVFELFDSRARAMSWDADLCARFEDAFQLLEAGNEAAVESRLRTIRTLFPQDGPTAFFLNCLESRAARQDGAWVVN